MKRTIALLMSLLMVIGMFGIFTGCDSLQEPGRVYFLNCVPGANEAWQKLAAMYADSHGVEVTVRTVSSDDHAGAFLAALESGNAPTAFQFGNADEYDALRGYCMDLTGTAVLGQMTTGDFNLADSNGSVRAIEYSYEAFGIIVNQALLEQAGHHIDDIQDFETLKAVAQDIHSRSAQLGFDAFASSGLAASSSWRFAGDLASVPLYYEFRDRGGFAQQTAVAGDYLQQYRQIWDLYIENAAADKVFLSGDTAAMSVEEFGTGKAAFLQHSASVYEELVSGAYAMDPEDLTMIPIYCGVEGEEKAALGCVDNGYWAVNAKASDADRKATLDFLNWVVTSGIGVLQQQFGGLPFKAAEKTSSGFYADAHSLIAQGNYAITGSYVDDEAWQDALAAALAVYAADQTDANWGKVQEVFVEDWPFAKNDV